MPTFFGVHFISPQEGVVVGLDEKIASTTDSGQKWTFAPEDPYAFMPDPLYALHLFPNGKGWVVGSSGIVMHSQDGEWKKADLGMEVYTWLRAVDFFDEENGWIVGRIRLNSSHYRWGRYLVAVDWLMIDSLSWAGMRLLSLIGRRGGFATRS